MEDADRVRAVCSATPTALLLLQLCYSYSSATPTALDSTDNLVAGERFFLLPLDTSFDI